MALTQHRASVCLQKQALHVVYGFLSVHLLPQRCDWLYNADRNWLLHIQGLLL